MQCEKHKDRIVLMGFSKGICVKCTKPITTSHTPCNKICDECSKKHGLCTICGKVCV